MPLFGSRPTLRRRPIALLVAFGVVLSGVVGVAPAAAAGPTSLRDVRGFSSSDFVITASPDCTAATPQLSYEATTPVSGPVSGTYRESGTLTMGATLPSGRRALTAVSATFAINDGSADVVQGVKTLAPARQNTPYGFYDFMNEIECESGYHQVTFAYEASSSGVVFERGHATGAGAAGRALSPATYNTVDFWAKPRVRLDVGATTEAGPGPAEHSSGYGPQLIVSPAPIDPVSVRVRSLSTGSATAVDDFTPLDQVLTIGGSAAAELYGARVAVPVGVLDDSIAEPIETVELEASEVTAAFLDEPLGGLRVHDNDAVVTLSSADIGEASGQLQLTATLTAPALQDVEVCLKPTAAGSAEYGDRSSPTVDVVFSGWSDDSDPQSCGYDWTLTVPTGSSSATFFPPVQVEDDFFAEWDETLEFGARWVVGAVAAAGSTSTLIVDDDGLPDVDGDLILDLIDTDPRMASADFVAGGTSGTVLDAAGSQVRVSDAPDPAGVRVEVSGTPATSGPARLTVCGFEVHLDAGSDVRQTCGSLSSDVRAGRATVFLDGGTSVQFGPGVVAKVDTVDGVHSVQVLQDTHDSGATLTVNGQVTTVNAGQPPIQMDVWTFTGFSAPVDNGGVVNSVRAGKAVPLKWRLMTANGQPVLDLAKATLTFQSAQCSGGTPAAVEQLAAGGSGLQNLGDGYYQMNWKTDRTPGVCGSLVLDMGKASGQANFKLTP